MFDKLWYNLYMEQIENLDKGEAGLNYVELKRSLLNGSKDVGSVRLELLKADQSSHTHEAAIDNLKFLEDEDIKSFISMQPSETQESYYKFLGFTQWHVAQDEMFKDKNEDGLQNFKKSLENSVRGNAEEAWILYGKGTIAYLEKNNEDLKNCIDRMPDGGKNKIILQTMLNGLEDRGEPDYKIDY
jgi:hypothetical protein